MTHEATNNDGAMRATGPALHEYLDLTAESKDSLSHFTNGMAKLLADRLGSKPRGADPRNYVGATQMLIYDCKDTGKNGFTGEPMPRDVTGQPPMMYGLFQGRSIELAREVFGDSFADEVEEIYSKIEESKAATDTENPKEAIDKTQAYEILKKVEGVDPVGAVLDGHPEDIPEEGWVIDANMELGSSAVIHVYGYGKGSEFREHLDHGDKREKYGRGAISMTLTPCEEYAILYETPQYPQIQRNKEPYDRLTTASYAGLSFDKCDIAELENGGRILDAKESYRYGRGHPNAGWTDIDRLAEEGDTEVKISRVTDDHEAVARIVAQLGMAMGMDQQGRQTLIETVGRKTQKTQEA